MEFLSVRISVRRVAAGVIAVPGGVAVIAEIPDHEVTSRKPMLQLGLEGWMTQKALTLAAPDNGDRGAGRRVDQSDSRRSGEAQGEHRYGAKKEEAGHVTPSKIPLPSVEQIQRTPHAFSSRNWVNEVGMTSPVTRSAIT
jgi:hypothetical protein